MIVSRRLFWFVLSRLILVVFFFLSASFFYTRDPALFTPEAIASIQRLCLAAGAFSLLSFPFLALPPRHLLAFSYSQIVWDVLFVTVLVLLTGGVFSPFPFMYLLAIINASVLHTRRESVYTASLCAILYGALLDFQYYGHLDILSAGDISHQLFGPFFYFFNLLINIGAFYLTALLTGHLASRARESEAALHEREIDYDELSRLNSAIVANIAGALVTVTAEGRIRVFNPAAERLTGKTLNRVYNQQIAEVFPGLGGGAAGLATATEGEFIQHRGADVALCSFRSVPFFDASGAIQGTIYDIRDVTLLRRLEDELQRAGCLAAVGSLAARMAHEIRNPLAAISGSVQLLASSSVSETDRPLLNIVMREADRLNQLLTDFLAYARPQKPSVVEVPLVQLVNEQSKIMAADPQFSNITINVAVRDDLHVEVDVGLFKQVLWNLFINASESMGGDGVLTITAKPIDSPVRGKGVELQIADNGPGVSDDAKERVFEPFFTTKVNGTGLGLATVYRIIEAHAGTIRLVSEQGKGTVFEIFLPSQSATASGVKG